MSQADTNRFYPMVHKHRAPPPPGHAQQRQSRQHNKQFHHHVEITELMDHEGGANSDVEFDPNYIHNANEARKYKTMEHVRHRNPHLQVHI